MIDTVAWVHLENGRILCARPRGKDVFYIPGGKREGAESDLETLRREISEELTVALLPGTERHVGTYQAGAPGGLMVRIDRKSTRLNSSHPSISYAVFCLKKKK